MGDNISTCCDLNKKNTTLNASQPTSSMLDYCWAKGADGTVRFFLFVTYYVRIQSFHRFGNNPYKGEIINHVNQRGVPIFNISTFFVYE